MKLVRVLIVDDSVLMRKLLSAMLEEDPGIEVVGTAGDPLEARERIKALEPDVLTLDIEMPRMDGLSFLRKIVELHPMPVIMVSSLTHAGAEATIEALEIGAYDFVAKPVSRSTETLEALAAELCAKVKAAAGMRYTARPAQRIEKTHKALETRHVKLVAIGASTGGVESLRAVLTNMGADCPPVVIAQHMPPRFTTAFANRLNRICPMEVCEAVHRQPVLPGRVYIAPGTHHLEVRRWGDGYLCMLGEGPNVSGHRPSVDVLFRSVAESVGEDALGVILTGMGKDGADGLLAMRRRGAMTVGQDEASSLIYGMPREAFERGAVERQLPLNAIGPAIMGAWHPETAVPPKMHRAFAGGLLS